MRFRTALATLAVFSSMLAVSGVGHAAGITPIAGPLRTSGNSILDATGKPVVLRGVVAGHLMNDPTINPGSEVTDQDIAGMINNWHANIIRIALGEQYWNATECQYEPKYRAVVDTVVHSITSRGAIALLDLHWNTRIPCFGAGQQRMADSPGSIMMWNDLAARYKDNPLVAFQPYNEPHDISWDQWRNGGLILDPATVWTAAGMQQMYGAIRATGAKNLVFVTGNNWGHTPPPSAYLLDGYNIVYAVNFYTCSQLPPPSCTTPDPTNPVPAKGQGIDQWATISMKQPVVITEFGWPDPNDGTFNARLISWAEAHGVGWIAFTWGIPSGPSDLGEMLFNIVVPQGDWGLLTTKAPTWQPVVAGAPVKAGLALNP